MVNLIFEVNPFYVIAKALQQNKNFQKLIPIDKFKEELKFTKEERVNDYFIYIFCNEDLIKAKMDLVIPLFDFIFNNNLHKQLLIETQDYRTKVKTSWNNYKNKFCETFEEVSGLLVPKNKIFVSIIHPSCGTGFASSRFHNVLKKDYISWAHHLSTKLKNYDNVYLFHEILHIIFNWKELDFKNEFESEVFHSLIELFADNEFRVRINKESYFQWDGHENLKEWEKIIYPYWIFFINRNKKNILEEVEKAFLRDKLNFSIEEYFELFEKFKIKKMNIIDFWRFLLENKIIN